ncbi:hypothetical protein TNCV_1493841 [Trichonephila clavipes]|nr:hypothetical protein TNCV_1493841 [Trichonephila clavipes]
MKKSSVEFISRSPTPSPMERNYRRFSSGIHGKEKRNTYRCGQRTVRIAVMACSQKQGSLRAQAQLKTRTKTFELVEEKQKLLDIRERKRTREVREQALPSAYHCQTYLPF